MWRVLELLEDGGLAVEARHRALVAEQAERDDFERDGDDAAAVLGELRFVDGPHRAAAEFGVDEERADGLADQHGGSGLTRGGGDIVRNRAGQR